MKTPNPTRTLKLVDFIRHGLGCGCPDDVLADIRVERDPAAFAGLPVDGLVDVGGRLLVGVCRSKPLAEVEGALQRCVETGRRVRDDNGFNRFRLVVATDEPRKAGPALNRRFDELPELDDRLHLHVVDASLLPRIL